MLDFVFEIQLRAQTISIHTKCIFSSVNTSLKCVDLCTQYAIKTKNSTKTKDCTREIALFTVSKLS